MDPLLILVSQFLSRVRGDFPLASDERRRKFTLDYLRSRGPRLMELIPESMLFPDEPPISPEVLAETSDETYRKLLETVGR